jgi:hypothetical protein
MINKFTRDEKLCEMESLFDKCIAEYCNNYSIGNIGKLLSLFNGKFKKQQAAAKLWYETYDNIANHLIKVCNVGNLETFVDYQNTYILPIAKSYLRPGFGTNVKKARKRIEKLIQKGKIIGVTISSEGDFVVTK